MITKNSHFICDNCGKFCTPYDSKTPFGCTYDMGGCPEPLDPIDYCKKCSLKEYKKQLEYFKNGGRNGDWYKSKAEIKASEKYNLIWITTFGKYGTPEYKHNCYITKEEYEKEIALLEKESRGESERC
jgi:hypothetical protein